MMLHKKGILLLSFLTSAMISFSQCEILNRIYPDGSMMYYLQPQTFFWTEGKSLQGNVVTDKENYFLALQPVPFPEKETGKKIKEDIELKLANDHVLRLVHYDTRYLQNDSIIELLFLLDEKDINEALLNEAMEVKINMGGKEGIRTYVFKLHKTAIQEQLACFLNEDKNKKKE
jgi:hypothetical protein